MHPILRLIQPGHSAWFAATLFLGWAGGSNVCLSADKVDFATQIAPILETHCITCHQADVAKGDLSLSTQADFFRSEIVTAGNPGESYLMEVIRPGANGEPPEMPKEGKPISEGEIDLIREWIAQGAEWPVEFVVREQPKADQSWWSLQPLHAAQPPPISRSDFETHSFWNDNPIDRFVLVKLQENHLKPNPAADRGTLIRRLTYDLTGLPPTPEEVDAYLSDSSEHAYEKLVDRLLQSPRYGERWGRHWLDVVRFGESTGYERNVIIDDAWPFRDYVIRSLNSDKPFNQFIREHIAGDVYSATDPQVQIGAAFLVNGPYDNVGNQDAVQAAQIRANTIDEMIRATTESFLGLTVGCARCHNHKFDPIPQQDYYQLYATFAGVKHGSRPLVSPEEELQHDLRIKPLNQRKSELTQQIDRIKAEIESRALANAVRYEQNWTREAVNRLATEEIFDPTRVRFVKLVCEARDDNPAVDTGFHIDEFEIWSADEPSVNVALSSQGASASGPSRSIEDFPGAYGPQIAIDGELGARFIAADRYLMIELSQATRIDRIVFSSARGEPKPDQPKFAFVGEYRIEVSVDGENWVQIANGNDRQPVSEKHRLARLSKLEKTAEDQQQLMALSRELQVVASQLAEIAPLPTAWLGSRDDKAAEGPFYIFQGGNPQQPTTQVMPASLSALDACLPGYVIDERKAGEGARRVALANWITDDANALSLRVLANRIWHYHFGTGIVATPSDFGFMGARPTHPLLLDFLAGQLRDHEWRLKPIHRLIVMSQTYRQSSSYRKEAAELDADARWLWRFPPRRLSAEEIRDSMLQVSGQLDERMGGPGFRLYRYLQDNVATYVPLDEHSRETYRRSVYHQNARACTTDLFSEFDQPDCAFSTPRRVATTTPLQALTTLNHQFTVTLSQAMADRIIREVGDQTEFEIERAFQLCFNRPPEKQELEDCRPVVSAHALPALCRALLNTSEFIYVR